jgi:hypothetical protein
VSRPPAERLRLLLRVWAGKLEAGTLSPDDAGDLATMLRHLADGKTVDQIFGVWRPANRPIDPARQQRMQELAALTLDQRWGGDGMPPEEAWDVIAEKYGRKPLTIRRDYYSLEMKEIRSQMEKTGQKVAQLRDPKPWRGGKSPK